MSGSAPEQALRDLGSDPALTVEIEDGTEHFRGGAIRLVVRGDGTAEVVHRRSGAVDRFDGELSAARVSDLGRDLAGLRFTGLEAPDRPLVPGETLIELTLRRGEETLHSVKLPSEEAYEEEDLEGILDLFTDLVSEVSGGRLPPKAAGAPP